MTNYCKSESKARQSSQLGYILTTPNSINENEKYPLIVFLHGAGERGDNLDLLKCYCVPKLFTNDNEDRKSVV